MYVPEHFREVDAAAIKTLVETAPLACVVAHTQDGLVANHIPLLQADDDVLIGHVALANDMHRLIGDESEVLAIFRGSDGYVSPNFYPTKLEHHRHVPTWNYQVVHVYGTISFQYDDRAKRAAVGLLTRTHERRVNGENAWRMANAPADYMSAMLGNIVALRIEPRRVLAKSKLSQNRDPRDVQGAVEGVRSNGNPVLAHEMEARTKRGD